MSTGCLSTATSSTSGTLLETSKKATVHELLLLEATLNILFSLLLYLTAFTVMAGRAPGGILSTTFVVLSTVVPMQVLLLSDFMGYLCKSIQDYSSMCCLVWEWSVLLDIESALLPLLPKVAPLASVTVAERDSVDEIDPR